MESVTAFYDDSGGFDPGGRKFACFGMDVIPMQYIRECGNAWREMLSEHFQYPPNLLPTLGIEAKSSELHNMLRCLKRGSSLQKVQQKIFDHGLNTIDKVDNLIDAILSFLEKPPVQVRYLAVIVNKEEAWQQFQTDQINQWRILKQLQESSRGEIKRLNSELSSFLIKHTYEYLLQRLEYLSKDADFNFGDAFAVGDQSSSTKLILETQTGIQAGFGKFSDLPAIVNKSWFGSSLHDPCLQMADWIAFAVRKWAEGKEYLTRIRQLLPNFRGYPDPDKLLGKGIVLCPNKECFPNLPLN